MSGNGASLVTAESQSRCNLFINHHAFSLLLGGLKVYSADICFDLWHAFSTELNGAKHPLNRTGCVKNHGNSVKTVLCIASAAIYVTQDGCGLAPTIASVFKYIA